VGVTTTCPLGTVGKWLRDQHVVILVVLIVLCVLFVVGVLDAAAIAVVVAVVVVGASSALRSWTLPRPS